MQALRKIDSIITKISTWIGVTSFLGMLFCVTLGVVSRMLNISIIWTEELSRYCLIWFVYGAVTTGIPFVESTSVEVLFNMLPPNGRKTLRTFYRIIMICFLCFMIWGGMKFALAGLNVRMTTLPLSIFWIRIAIPLGSLLMIFKLLFFIICSYSASEAEMAEEGNRMMFE